MKTPDQVTIFDTTLRDGEQCPGASTDIIEASAAAYLNAVNRHLAQKKRQEGAAPRAEPGV